MFLYKLQVAGLVGTQCSALGRILLASKLQQWKYLKGNAGFEAPKVLWDEGTIDTG